MKIFAALVLLAALALAVPQKEAREFVVPAWGDLDGDCRDTRTEVIAYNCRVAWARGRCWITSSECQDFYGDGRVSGRPVVDRVLPPLIAWGRREWRQETWIAFLNDPINLVVTADGARPEGSLMPHEWCPQGRPARLAAASRTILIARAWSIPLSDLEKLGVDAWSKGECLAEN